MQKKNAITTVPSKPIYAIEFDCFTEKNISDGAIAIEVIRSVNNVCKK